MRKNAFTLAEVLITLGIIGVVAVLTIPTLVRNYQMKSWNTAATVFERRFEEAIKTMNVQGQLGSRGGYNTTEGFVDELQNHLKITKVCTNDKLAECFEDEIIMNDEAIDMRRVTTSKHFGQEAWNTNILGVMAVNGTSALIAYNPDCKSDPYDNDLTGRDCYAMVYDTSGFAQPNTIGKDTRKNINVLNIKGKSCSVEAGDHCYTSPAMPAAMTYNECVSKKDELGIPYCCPVSFCKNKDYFAGAVASCGGINNLPTIEELADFASSLYVGNPKLEGDSSLNNASKAKLYTTTYDYNSAAAQAIGLNPPYRLMSSNYLDYAVKNEGQYAFWAWAVQDSSKDSSRHSSQWTYFSYLNAPVYVMCKAE